MSETITLDKQFSERTGVPTIKAVNLSIFRERYFMKCMECFFCFDSCCSYGCTIAKTEHQVLQNEADHIEKWVGVPQDQWFTNIWETDREYPGGESTRTP